LFDKVLDNTPVSQCGGVMQTGLTPAVRREQINATPVNFQQLKPHIALQDSTSTSLPRRAVTVVITVMRGA